MQETCPAREPYNKDGCNYRYDWLSQHEANNLSVLLDHLNYSVREDITELMLLTFKVIVKKIRLS